MLDEIEVWEQIEVGSDSYRRRDVGEPAVLTKSGARKRVKSFERPGRVLLITWLQEYLAPLTTEGIALKERDILRYVA